MPFRPIIPLLPVPKPGLLSRLTGTDRTPEIANALITADFPRVAAIIADAGPEALDKARPKLARLLVRLSRPHSGAPSPREGVGGGRDPASPAAIPKPECQRIYALAMKRALSRAIEQAIADNHLDDDEFDRIKNLAKRPIVTPPFPAVSSALPVILWHFETLALWPFASASTASERIAASVNQFLDDGLFSDEEWGRTEALAKNLRVNLGFHANSKADVEYARDRWRALNGKLDVISAPGIALKDDEGAYFDGECDWYELKTIARQVSFGGLTGSVRIAKGLRFYDSSLRMTNACHSPLTNRRP